MNPYLKLLGVLAALFLGVGFVVGLATGDASMLLGPLGILGAALGVLWLVIMAVRRSPSQPPQ